MTKTLIDQVKKLSPKAGDIIVIKIPEDLPLDEILNVNRKLELWKEETGQDVIFFMSTRLTGDIDLNSVSEDEMNKHGWFKHPVVKNKTLVGFTEEEEKKSSKGLFPEWTKNDLDPSNVKDIIFKKKQWHSLMQDALRALPGVKFVEYELNYFDYFIASIEFTVKGGSNIDIAVIIHNLMPMGAKSEGKVLVELKFPSGFSCVERFSRPEQQEGKQMKYNSEGEPVEDFSNEPDNNDKIIGALCDYSTCVDCGHTAKNYNFSVYNSSMIVCPDCGHLNPCES